MTASAIEPATFRFVAQHLSHCATAGHVLKYIEMYILHKSPPPHTRINLKLQNLNFSTTFWTSNMKADRLHKFNSLALHKLENTKQNNKKHVSSTVVLIIRRSKYSIWCHHTCRSPFGAESVGRVYFCSFLVCIVVIFCVFAVLCVYCCFYFRSRTAGQKSVFWRSYDRPPGHRFFLVSLCI